MKSVFQMTASELYSHTESKTEMYEASDLEIALAATLEEAVRLLTICTEQLQECSPNEFVIGRTGDTNIAELLAFCEVAG